MSILLMAAFCIISELGCYKFIKNLDKKERKKLQRWEDNYINSRKEETDRYLEMQRLKLEEKKKREEEIAKEKAKEERKKKREEKLEKQKEKEEKKKK